jgi:hypothetical protein
MLHSYVDFTGKIIPCPSSSQPPNNENHTNIYPQASSAAGAASFRKVRFQQGARDMKACSEWVLFP